jgi:hypothetical protein
MTFFYDINKRLADLDQNKPILNESQQQVDEKYMGFDKTVAAIKKGGSAENPEAVAAAIGRKKYGKERFQKAAAAGKKLGEQSVAEGSLNEGQYEMMLHNGRVKKFVAKDDADAKRIAAGHGAKSVIKLKGGVPAGKVSEQGVAEGSKELGDEFAAMLSGMGKSFRRGPAPRKPESAPRDYSADIAALPELRAQYEELMRKFKSLGGSSYQYADREQNLSDSERQARDLWNGPIQDLRRKINAAEKAQGEQGMTEDEMGEGNEFSGALAQARATGQKEFEVDGRTYPVNEGRVERTDQGVRHHGNYGTEYQGDDDEDESPAKKRTKDGDDKGSGKKRGRPAAARDTYNAPFGTVDIPKWKGPKTVHKIGDAEPGKKAPQRGRPKKVREQDDMIDIVDRGEYDREGDMAHDQLRTVMDAAKELRGILRADENLPEWVQSKITKALDYIDTARDYMKSQKSSDMEPVTEKAVSRSQQQAAGIALAARKSGKKPQAGTASAEMAKMPEKELEKFASTKHKGLPKKVKETTTSGSVAVADTAEPKKAKGKSSVSFGKGIYDSWNRELEQMISESMNITVTQSTSDTGEIDKSISVNATGDDAVRLAQLLSLAGIEGHHDHEDHSCPTCGQEPCGCAEIVDENSPDWPTNTEYNQDSLQYSGGLNRPKSTGQTTVPVIASQLDRQMSESTDLDYIKKMLG